MEDGIEEVDPQLMKKQLHRLIGPLDYESINTSMAGRATGILIAPNLVLTAAHNVFNNKSRETYHNIRFYPGQSGPL